jgi:pyridoxine 5-phosphate synthase
VGAVAAIEQIIEFNIGHNIIARAIFVGLGNAVKEMRTALSSK